MSYFRCGDPDDDFRRLEREQARYEARLPVCEHCGERIDDDHYFYIEGEILCYECMIEKYRRSTDDYENKH